MGAIQVHHPHPSLFLIRFDRECRVRDFQAHLDELKELHDGARKFGVLVNISALHPKFVNSQARTEASIVQAHYAEYFRHYCVCAARLTNNPIIRGILTVFDCLSTQHWESKTFGRGHLAEDWVHGQLARAGVALPAERYMPLPPMLGPKPSRASSKSS